MTYQKKKEWCIPWVLRLQLDSSGECDANGFDETNYKIRIKMVLEYFFFISMTLVLMGFPERQ